MKTKEEQNHKELLKTIKFPAIITGWIMFAIGFICCEVLS